MKTFLILGAGTAGTMVANKMAETLNPDEWKMIIIDQEETHYYQPGFLFIPFGIYSPSDVIKPKRDFIPHNVEFVLSKIDLIEPDNQRVILEKENRIINYDYLVIATGSHIDPSEIEGLSDNGWHENVYDFYTIEGATALSRFFKFWKGGRKCPSSAQSLL
jgi:sulfide:quinone oxidoreductase